MLFCFKVAALKVPTHPDTLTMMLTMHAGKLQKELSRC